MPASNDSQPVERPLPLVCPDIHQVLGADGVLAGAEPHSVLFAKGTVFLLDRRPLLLQGGEPGVREGVVATGRVLTAGDLAGVREYLRSYGAWGPVAAFLLIQLQAVFAPLPSFPVVYAAGFLFGTFWGGLLSWVSVLVSAALCFGLARGFGRPLVECVVSPRALRRADALFLRHGTFAVLLARLLPFTAFDLLSYAAGLTPMSSGSASTSTAVTG